ncbi:MAG: phosphatase PAP2 family protein [Anaerolineaceae bacterium]|nr:phosphatase PAP2 family protein [Anaerolineaceae bacterium]
MTPFWEFQILLSLWFQNIGDWLLIPMKLFTSMGQEEFYMLVLPALYWCLESRLGIRIGFMLMISNYFGNFFKIIFHIPRPAWVSPKIKPLVHETTFGFPSGHSTNAAGIWGLAAVSTKQKWIRFTLLIVILMIGISRIYLGVHSITDILSGWMLGGILLFLFIKFEDRLVSWFKLKPFKKMLLWNILVSTIAILLGIILDSIMSTWQLPQVWIQNAALTSGNEPISPLSQSYLFTTSGTIFGLILGLSILYSRKTFYSIDGTVIQKIFRYLLGTIILFAIWYGLKFIFPAQDNFIGFAFRFIRYALVGFWVSAGAPYTFIKMGLAGTNSD